MKMKLQRSFFLRQDSIDRINNGDRLRARWGFSSLVSALLILLFQAASPLIFRGDMVIVFGYAALGWVIPFVLACVGIVLDDRKLTSMAGVVTSLVFGLPLILLSLPIVFGW